MELIRDECSDKEVSSDLRVGDGARVSTLAHRTSDIASLLAASAVAAAERLPPRALTL